jgi:FkbM family methyltransferase
VRAFLKRLLSRNGNMILDAIVGLRIMLVSGICIGMHLKFLILIYIYNSLDVKDKVVVDIGAYVGDSAIYFALKGARKVIAVEPHPKAFEEMIDNMKLNKLEDIIIPINAGLASKLGGICIDRNVDVIHTVSTYYKPDECNNKVPTMTLEELIRKYDIDRGAVLKMDCEGCEYDVILNDYERVRLFNEVYFEYHAYVAKIPVELLLKKLSRDFICKVVSDDEFYKRHGLNKELIGIIKCVKK